VVSSYLFAHNVINLATVEAQTVSVTVLVIVGLYLVLALEAAGRVRAALVSALCAVLFVLYMLVLVFEGTRDFFMLSQPTAAIMLCSFGGSALAITGLWLTDDRFVPSLRLPKSLPGGR